MDLGTAGGELALLAPQLHLRLVHHGRGHAPVLLVLVWVLQSEGRDLRHLGLAPELTLELVELGQAEEVGEARREVREVGREVWWKGWEETGGRLRFSRAVLLGTSLVPVHVDDGQGVGRPVIVEHHGWLVAVLLQVELQRVTVLGGVGAVGTSVLVDVGVGLHMTVQHALVDATVVTVRTAEWLRTYNIQRQARE